MHKPIVLIGTGEMGGVFSRGFLRQGYPIYPVNRGMALEEVHAKVPQPQMVLIAVGENDLAGVLAELPESWNDRLCLLQNELLPNNWTGVENPTVISVWFEKKPGQEAKVIIPSPVYGPQSELISQSLESLLIPTKRLSSHHELLFELVLKNIYILTTNIAGLRTGGTVGGLWENHQQLTRNLACEVIRIQEAMTGVKLNTEALIEAMLRAFAGDPDHQCMGRSAPARLQRALAHADQYDLPVPLLRQIQAEHAMF